MHMNSKGGPIPANNNKNQLSIVVKGRVISGRELQEYAERNGLCPICGLSQTHERQGTFLRPKFEPKTVKNNRGEFTVYKGFCIAPTCYSLEEARIRLGEVKAKRKPSRPVDRRRDNSSRGGRTIKPFQPPNVFQPSSIIPSTQRQNAAYAGLLDTETGNGSGSFHMAAPSELSTEVSTASTSRFRPTGGGAPMSRIESTAHRNPLHAAGMSHGHNSSNSDFQGPFQNSGGIAYDSSMNFDAPAPLVVGSHLPTSEKPRANPKSDEDELVVRMEEKIQEQDYLEFLNLLDHRATYSSAVLEGLRTFRMSVAKDQTEKPNGVVLVGDNWVKVINDKIRKFQAQGEREVVVSGLVTLLTFSRLPGGYKKSMIRKDTLGTITKLFDDSAGDSEIIALSCAVVTSLALTEKHSLNAKSYAGIATLIRKLVHVLFEEDEHASEAALEALYHLANQRKRAEATGKPALHDIYGAIVDKPLVDVVIRLCKPPTAAANTIEGGIGLLWRLSALQDDGRGGSIRLNEEQLYQLLSIMSTMRLPEIVEAICGLLSNLSLSQDVSPDVAQLITEALCEFLANPEHQLVDVATAATHAMCNLLASTISKPGVLAAPALIGTIVHLLEKLPNEEEFVENTCLAIGHACVGNQGVREAFIFEGAVEHIQKVFETHVQSRDGGPSLAIKDASLCAFAALSGCLSGAELIIESGLLNVVEAMITVEIDRDFKATMEVILANCDGRMSSKSNQGILRQQPTLFAQLIKNSTSEEEVVSLVQELRDLGQQSLGALGLEGFDSLLSAMSRYEYSPSVQGECCYFLCGLFSRIETAEIGAPTQLSKDCHAILHKHETVKVLCSSMTSYRGNSEIQVTCLYTLFNFFLPFHMMDVDSHSLRAIQPWLEQVWTCVLDALSYNAHDSAVQEAGFTLCWTLVTITSKNQLQSSQLRILQQILDSTRLFRTTKQLNIVACEVLLVLQKDHDCLEYIANSSCIETLMLLLGENGVEIVTRASAVLAWVVTHAFTAVNQLMGIPNVLQRLLTSMRTFQSRAAIQIHICMVLEAIINFEDISIRAEIGHCGAVEALCGAMESNKDHQVLGQQSSSILALILPHLDITALGATQNRLENILLQMLNMNVECAEVEAPVIDALGALSKDEHFQARLIADHELQTICQAMALHLESEELQRVCCRLFWSLCGYPSARERIGHHGGIFAVLNAMLAHNQSTLVQKEALTALKNLATEANNKPFIAAADGTQVVTYALWIHYLDPSVLSVAMSALNNIAVDSSTRSVAPMPVELLVVVLSAMRRFPQEEAILKNACFYLKSCSYLAANLELMRDHSQEIIPLLEYAGQMFPQSCQSRGSSIIKKLTPGS